MEEEGRVRKRLFVVAFLISSFGLIPSFPRKGDPAHAAEAGWQAEWERTLEAARKEGQVVIYGSDIYGAVFSEFQKKYPGLKVTLITSLEPQMAQRILSERRAGKYLADLYLSGVGTGYNVLYKGKILDPIKPLLILPEVVDESKWWNGKHHYVDEKGEYLLAFDGESQPYFAFNTKLVKPHELKSYWDLLDPKWKGKIVMMDPSGGSAGTAPPLKFIYYTPELGVPFLRRFFSEMDLTASRDTRKIADWLAVGKFALTAFTYISRTDLDVAKAQGLPVDWFGPKSLKEGTILSSANGNIGLLNRAAHPHASKIAINWLLSREGQIAFQKTNPGNDSLRIDIPKDGVAPYARRLDGVRYLDAGRPEYADMAPILKVINEVWKKR